MKSKLKQLISEYHDKLTILKQDREVARKLNHVAQVTLLIHLIDQMELLIKDLSELL